jgi:hypothetical protein
MQVFSTDETTGWSQKRGITLSGNKLSFDAKNTWSLDIQLPKDARELTALAFSLLNVNPSGNFQGALLWFKDWAMHSSDLDQSGLAILQQMRRGHGQEKTLAESPGHVFLEDEWLPLYSFFMIPLWYRWDAFLAESHGNWFIFTSHEGHLHMIFKERLWLETAQKSLAGWNPKE